MGEYVRRVKTGSGATAVQIASKTRGVRSIIEHVGSAHTDLELELMVQTAKTRIRERAQAAGQAEFQIDTPAVPVMPRITMHHSYSRLLYDTLAGLYDQLGFTDAVNDRVFRDLVIARIIEPASKLDTIRILENLGLKAPSNSGIHRSLNQAADHDYRDKFAAACVTFRGTEHLTLVLYDVTTLFFQVEREDEYRKPGLSKERRLEPQIVVGLLVDERGFPLQLHSFGRGETRRERRVVYQYREKRARLDLRNIEKQVEKARKVVAGTTPVKKGRFLKISGAAKSIDEALVESARQRAGIKGYVTNLPILTAPALAVIDAYHQLFNVEASFRMAKTDLKARPIFHRQREKIEAHLTVVFCAIAISRHIQEATGVSVKKFVQQLARVQDGVVSIEGVEHVVPAAIPGEVREILTQLSGSGAGH